MIKVSVIVPVYNVEKYLRKCLDSIINQTLKDIEIIVVNDGTKDNSQDIIDEYTKKYKNIKGYIKENGGLSSARNYGIKRAVGEYISFIDSDDYIKDDMLEKMYNKAKKDDLDIVVCDSIEIYEDGREVYKKANMHYSDNEVNNFIIAPPMACCRIYKKYIFDKIEFEDKILYEDLNLNPLLVNTTNKIGFVEEGLYYYFQRNGSIMNQKKFNDKLLDIFKVLDNNYKGLVEQYPDEVEYLYISHLLRTATLRFLEYDVPDNFDKINHTMKDKFPNWRRNKYYKKSSGKLKLICNLAYGKNILLLKLIKRLASK